MSLLAFAAVWIATWAACWWLAWRRPATAPSGDARVDRVVVGLDRVDASHRRYGWRRHAPLIATAVAFAVEGLRWLSR